MSALERIRYTEVRKSFQRRLLLARVEISVESGAAILLSGENGAGKTTLLRILAGLERPTQCMVEFVGGDAPSTPQPWARCKRWLQREVMYLHQQPYLFDGDVTRNLALALPRNLGRAERARKVAQALEWARLGDLAANRAKALSSGEKQRVALARAWLRRAQALLLDEPIANMDNESQTRTVALLARLKRAGAALMIASHNDEAFAELIDRRLVLTRGELLPAADTSPNVTPLTIEADNPRSTRSIGERV
ncbi:MAG: ABC transporter ATP-binding protein [bacterium]